MRFTRTPTPNAATGSRSLMARSPKADHATLPRQLEGPQPIRDATDAKALVAAQLVAAQRSAEGCYRYDSSGSCCTSYTGTCTGTRNAISYRRFIAAIVGGNRAANQAPQGMKV